MSVPAAPSKNSDVIADADDAAQQQHRESNWDSWFCDALPLSLQVYSANQLCVDAAADKGNKSDLIDVRY